MSILGPEGYCRACRFVVSLDEDGNLGIHRRAADIYGGREPCRGAGKRPPKNTPYASRKSVFKVRGPVTVCHGCGEQVKVGTGGVFPSHRRPTARGSALCGGSYQAPRS